MVMPSKAKRPRRPSARSCLGPVADLEAHLPEEWWRKLFNALYVKTDGDVVENLENTRREVDFIVSAAAMRTVAFWQLAGTFTTCGFSMSLLSAHGVPMLTDHGYTPMLASWTFGVLGGSSIVFTMLLAVTTAGSALAT